MIFYLGLIYILVGIAFLLIPLIYIELGRPKDFLKAGLNLLIGIVLIIKNKVFENYFPWIYLLITILFIFYIVEIFFIRWNQLTNKEQKKLVTLEEFKKNLRILLKAVNLGLNNLINLQNIFPFNKVNENSDKKKWVRNNENENIKF